MKKLLFISLSILISVSGFAQIVELWAEQYNGPDNFDDQALVIAVDSSGNVYVGGRSQVVGVNWDYATVKYNAAGVEQWAARYDGTGSGEDIITGLAVDNQGNVYVTGYSQNALNYDYATIKYNSAGTEQWVKRYNGSADDDDYARDLVIDDSSNVYVIGRSRETAGASATNIKYNTDGVEQWNAQYIGGGGSEGVAITIDNSGNIYACGQTMTLVPTTLDYLTIKYDTAGDTVWVAIYNGPTSDADYAKAIAVDYSGNVYVTGLSDLALTWDYGTVKYNSDGIEQWSTNYNGPNNGMDEANAIVVDDSGNVYVTGLSEGPVSSYDFLTVKYNTQGDTMWEARYNGTGNGFDHAHSIEVDDSGYVYVAGQVTAIGPDSKYGLVKYDMFGDTVWTVYYGPNGGFDGYNSTAMTMDSFGCIYITGRSIISGAIDYSTVKYCQWTVGVNEQIDVSSNYNVYPNPTTGKFTVQGTVSTIQVYDLFGRLVLRTNKPEIDMSSYPAGLYIWSIGTERGKIVLE